MLCMLQSGDFGNLVYSVVRIITDYNPIAAEYNTRFLYPPTMSVFAIKQITKRLYYAILSLATFMSLFVCFTCQC